MRNKGYFGPQDFEYAPMRISFKKKILLSDLTPKSPDAHILREIGITLGICLVVVILGIVIISMAL